MEFEILKKLRAKF